MTADGGRRRPTVWFGVLFSSAFAVMFAVSAYSAVGQAVLRHDLAERGVTVDAEVLDEGRPRGGGLKATVSYSVEGTLTTARLESYDRSVITMNPQVRYDPEDPGRVMLAADVENAVPAYGAVAQALLWLLACLAGAAWLVRQDRRERTGGPPA
ncbi:DUF3592 domain-containing protein [Catellatospora vulcania]|uniref:DUF3592 domain-containing protein n=1 Tax=Catellatospora vulcania TaxID=1460450 RepID=UPI0012D47A78|nr:DUF3592 domain-containing protein [Catellatospora vulcania]